jgi:Tfp pilus assembly protein PilF
MGRRYKEILIAIGLAALTFAAFGQVVDFGFVNFDDDGYVTENPHIPPGLTRSNIWWALTTTSGINWHPLTWFSYQVDYQLYGLQAWGFHLTNLVLHIANTILLFLLLARWTGALWPSALAAALFACHPLHAESVAWVADRKDVLSTTFWMLTLFAYTFYADSPSVARYGLLTLVFALGLLAKSTLATLPFVMLLLDFWPLGRLQLDKKSQREAWPNAAVARGKAAWPLKYLILEKAPLLLLAVSSSAIVLLAQHPSWSKVPAGDWPLRLENGVVCYVAYLGKTIWPLGLSAYYPFPRHHYPLPLVLGTGVVVAGVLCLIFRWRMSRPYLLVGWLWYLVTIFPVIQIIPVAGGHAMADHYTYVPLVGIFVMVAWGLADLSYRWHCGPIAALAAAVILVLLLVQSSRQAAYWRDSGTLWAHAIEVTPNSALAHNNLGVVLEKEGRLANALAQFAAAVAIDDDYAIAHDNMGSVLERIGKKDEAIRHYQMSLAIAPGLQKVVNLARLFFEKGNWDKAIRYYREALRVNSDDADIHFYLGRAFVEKGDWTDAAESLRQAVLLRENSVTYRCALAFALASAGKEEAAREQYQEALRLDSNWPLAANQAAWVLATHPDPRKRNGPHALELARMICQATGDQNPQFLDTLAAAQAEVGRFDEAAATARKAQLLARDKPELALAIGKRLELYLRHEPIRDSAAATRR